MLEYYFEFINVLIMFILTQASKV